MQVSWLTMAVLALALFGIAEAAETRRRNRGDIDAVGFMPWRVVALVSVAVALLSLALWIKG